MSHANLQHCLHNIAAWSECQQLTLSVKKCAVMHMRPRRHDHLPQVLYDVHSINLPTVDDFTDLGVMGGAPIGAGGSYPPHYFTPWGSKGYINSWQLINNTRPACLQSCNVVFPALRHRIVIITARCTTVQSTVLLSVSRRLSVCLWRWWIITT